MSETEGPVETFEQKVDRRFDQVTDALVELRGYTDFAYSRLDAKLDGVDAKMRGLDAKVDGVDVKVDGLDAKLSGVDAKVERLDGGFGRLERKLDQFIDTQTRTNLLVERRLSGLEPQAPPSDGQL